MRERGLGTDGASWDLPGTGLEKEIGREKQRMGFPAKACLGSVPNPAVKAGREAQASLFCTERDEGTSGSSRGGEGEVAGSAWGGHPNLVWLCGAESAGASARAKRVRSGPGLGCTV